MGSQTENILTLVLLLVFFLILIWLLLKCMSSIFNSIWYCFYMRVVAIDTERVGAGYKGSIDVLARVSIVDTSGKVLLDKYVKPVLVVTDYRTPWSGITKEDLMFAEDYYTVRKKVANIIRDCILVGHDLKSDLAALDWHHNPYDIRDTAFYMPFRRMYGKNLHEKLSLKFLASRVLGRYIQIGAHDSVEDARAAMDLYLTVARQWEETYTRPM